MSSGSVQPFRNTIEQREEGTTDSDEKKTVRSPQPERIGNVPHRPEFKEASQTGFAKALLCYELAQQREAKLAHVALIMVRRQALRRLLEEERQLNAKELSQRGLAIYQQRI